MSGVIDSNGIQWEHCCRCNCWVEIDNLIVVYENDTPHDLCPLCYMEYNFTVQDTYIKEQFPGRQVLYMAHRLHKNSTRWYGAVYESYAWRDAVVYSEPVFKNPADAIVWGRKEYKNYCEEQDYISDQYTS